MTDNSRPHILLNSRKPENHDISMGKGFGEGGFVAINAEKKQSMT
jgi:hypothetical protein